MRHSEATIRRTLPKRPRLGRNAVESVKLVGWEETITVRAMLGLLILVGACGIGQAQQAADGIEVIKVRPNFYLIAGAGGNIGVQIGDDGVLLVDAGSAAAASQAVAAVKKLTDEPIRFI